MSYAIKNGTRTFFAVEPDYQPAADETLMPAAPEAPSAVHVWDGSQWVEDADAKARRDDEEAVSALGSLPLVVGALFQAVSGKDSTKLDQIRDSSVDKVSMIADK